MTNNLKNKFINIRTVSTAIILSLTLVGCSSPAQDNNSEELESLKNQVEELSKENASLKEQLETTIKETTPKETIQDSSGDLIQLGETSSLDDWSITVTSVELVDSIPDGYGSFSPDSGNKYLITSLTITNNGKSAETFLPSFAMGTDVQAKILYDDGYEFSATHLLGYSKGLHDQSLNPLSSKDGDIAFEIPDSVANATDELILHLKAGNSNLNIKVR